MKEPDDFWKSGNHPVLSIRGEAQFKRLVELSPDTIAVLREGRFALINSAGLRLFGAAAPNEVIGKGMPDFILPDNPIGQSPDIDSGAPRANPSKIFRMNGTLAEADLFETEILFEKAPATLLFIIDMSDRNRAEAELRKTKDWLEMVLSGMSDGLSVYDRQYRWVFMNKVAETRIRESGRDPAVLLGKPLWDVLPHISDTVAGHKLREVMEQRISASFEEKHGQRWYEIYISPTEDGGVATLSRDITERKLAEEELNESREALSRLNQELERCARERTEELARTVEELKKQYEQKQEAERSASAERRQLDRLTELLPIGIMLVSPDYRVIFENRFFREHFGDVDSKLCYQLLFGRGEPCEKCMGHDVLEKNSPHYWEVQDQKGRAFGLHGFPFTGTDGSPVVLVIGIDITERRQAKKQLENANRQLAARAEQMRALLIELTRAEDSQRLSLAQVLHDELQQILVAIKFSAEFLLHRPGLAEHGSEVHRIIDLVTQSIKVTRSLTTELSPAVLREAGLAGGLHWLARRMKESHGLEVELSIPETAPELREELRIMLFQMIRELLFNVVKHADTHKAKITVTHENGREVHIVVEDQGKGFNFSEKSETTPGSFGLFSIRERLSILNGNMDIISRPGKGTKICLRVPIPFEKAPKLRTSTNRPEVIPEAAITEPGMARVLVVDDHAVVREGLVEILQKQPGMVVVGEAMDGEEAVERARQLHPSIVLMDITLPRMNGIDATRIITHEMPSTHVIALSMHAQEDMASRMREAGADRYLLKDSPVGELVSAIYDTMNIRTQHTM